jgi:hypothetical protein
MRHAFTLINSSLICLLSSVPCLAQATGPEEPEKSYVLPYFVVGLGITLGLVAICRPSKRRKEVRPSE